MADCTEWRNDRNLPLPPGAGAPQWWHTHKIAHKITHKTYGLPENYLNMALLCSIGTPLCLLSQPGLPVHVPVQTGLPPYPNCVKVQPNRNMAMSTSLMATRKGTVAHPERPQGNSRGLDCCGNCIRRDICNDAIAVVNLVGERHDPHTPTCLGHCCCWRHLSTGGCTDVWV